MRLPQPCDSMTLPSGKYFVRVVKVVVTRWGLFLVLEGCWRYSLCFTHLLQAFGYPGCGRRKLKLEN